MRNMSKDLKFLNNFVGQQELCQGHVEVSGTVLRSPAEIEITTQYWLPPFHISAGWV